MLKMAPGEMTFAGKSDGEPAAFCTRMTCCAEAPLRARRPKRSCRRMEGCIAGLSGRSGSLGVPGLFIDIKPCGFDTGVWGTRRRVKWSRRRARSGGLAAAGECYAESGELNPAMPLVKVETKYQVTLPGPIRRRARLHVGDLLEARVEKG